MDKVGNERGGTHGEGKQSTSTKAHGYERKSYLETGGGTQIGLVGAGTGD